MLVNRVNYLTYTGGLIGYSSTDMEIENCWATGTVTTGADIGGLMGYFYNASGGDDDFKYCYSTSKVDGSRVAQYAGGLVGFCIDITPLDCYAQGSVSNVIGSAGGLIGYASSGSFTDCYTTGAPLVAAENGYYQPGITDCHSGGTTDMKQADYANWDFTNVWTTNGDTAYPFFKGVVTIEPNGGYYLNPQNVKINANLDSNETVYYTTDGSTPTTSSSSVTSSGLPLTIAVTASETIEASVYNATGTPKLSDLNITVFTIPVLPVPTITNFTPTSGVTSTGVNITGTGFYGVGSSSAVSAVSFGGTAAASYTVNSDSSITAYVGSGATGLVSVTTGGGTATSTGLTPADFTFMPSGSQVWYLDSTGDPAMERTLGIQTGSVTFSGGQSETWLSDLQAATQVTFQSGTWTIKLATGVDWSGSCSAEVGDFNPAGSGTFTIFDAPVTGTYGNGVITITITTSGIVSQNHYLALKIFNSDTADHSVTTDGSSSLTSPTTDPGYPLAEMPTVVGAATNASGTTITITLSKAMANPSGDQGQFTYQIGGGTTQSFSVAALDANTSEIDLTTSGTPIAYGNVVTVNYTAGTVIAADGGVLGSFTAHPVTNNMPALGAPTVTNINTTSGPTAGGTVVTVTGTGFYGGTVSTPAVSEVNFGTTAGTSLTVTSDTSLSITSPAGSGTVDITVVTPGGTSATSAADKFTYVAASNPAPTLTSILPTSGNRLGTYNVVFTGTNFITGVSSANVSTTGLDIVVNSATVDSPTQITANITIKAGAAIGAHNFWVSNAGPGGGSSGDQTFTVNNPAPTLTSILPTSGNRLDTFNVVFTGTNFITGVSSVNVGSGINVNSTTVNSATQITANITITAGAATGGRDFWVTNAGPGGGDSANQTFTVNSAAPPATYTLTMAVSPSGEGTATDQTKTTPYKQVL